jgi:hypothetical protein
VRDSGLQQLPPRQKLAWVLDALLTSAQADAIVGGVLLPQSYYGAALCVCWSPDAAFVASGGEDDLVATYSVAERQVQHAWL